MNREQRLTRRELLRWSAGALLAAGLWPGALHAGDSGKAEEFHFIVVNDTHYVDKRCGAWLQKVVARMKGHAEKIDFCILAGDLVEHGKPEQFEAVRDVFKVLDKPTHVVIGNHDYRTQEDRRPYEETFPDRLNYRFEHRGWQFVGLDTSEGVKFEKTNIQPHTLKWLDETLPKLDKKRPTIVFTHFPLNSKVKSCPNNAGELLERFKEYNLQAVFSGHYHAFTETQVGNTTLTTNRCCSLTKGNHDGSKEKGYFLCQAKDDKITRMFVEVKPA